MSPRPHNTPDYYRWHPAAPECYLVAQEFSYNIGNALTYLWRAGRKPGNTAVKDLEKAIDHIRFEIERLRARSARPGPAEERFSGPVTGLEHIQGVTAAIEHVEGWAD